MQAAGKNNMQAVLIDNMGKSYSIPAHTLPSARGQGEPLTKFLQPSPGATFVAAVLDESAAEFVLASDFGYGFIVKLEDLISKTRTGKAVLKLQSEAKVVKPVKINDRNNDLLGVITNEGRFLVFPVADLPELARGKGNKIIQIPSQRASKREEFVTVLAVFPKAQPIILVSGKRELKVSTKDLENFTGQRGQRGQLLPKGFRGSVDEIKA